MFQFIVSTFDRFLHPLQIGKRKQKKIALHITKRQKFVTSVFLLAALLLYGEYLFGQYLVLVAVVLGIVADAFLGIALFEDLQANFNPQVFILPFFCSLSFGLFYFLTPSRLIARIILTILYAISLYSLFLSENIFVVAASRTIALLNSARIVTFVISLLSYFFLTTIILSLRLVLPVTALLFLIVSVCFVYHSLWTYTLESKLTKHIALWISVISLCLLEIMCVLWFWPTSPTVTALFLTSMYYIFIGLTHVWFDKRLFKTVFWEYAWVAVFAVLILLWFTTWQG
ncbi:MAG TPA: hypothetical protein VGT05_00940 [Patescibacteria group bacterium]|nr:hypothetical protein [Patescibacteria group bacterium]